MSVTTTFDFRDQLAIVTGASGALGQVVARRLYDRGARLALPDRRAERLAASFPEIVSAPDRCVALQCAVTEPDSVAAFARELEAWAARAGTAGPDILVNVAGGFAGGTPVAATAVETWDTMLAVNARSTFLMCRALLPAMVRRPGSRIVSVASRAAERGGAGAAAYSAAKAAVVRLTESLAAEVGPAGVRVNCVLPGTLDTEANRQAMPAADRAEWVSLEAVADVILFLLSPLARAVHGVALPVYGPEPEP